MNRALPTHRLGRWARPFFACGTIALVARVAVACATSDTAPAEPPAEDRDGSSTVTPPPLEDVTSPADGGVEADASESLCTEEAWCYTKLPSKDDYDASAMPPIIIGPDFALRGVWVAPDSRAWAVSTAGHVLLWDGATWRVAAIMTTPLWTVWGTSADEVWVGGERGEIYRGKVTGTDVAFEKISIATTQTIARITATSDGDVWAIADGQSGTNNLNRVWRFVPSGGGQGGSFVQMTVPSSFTHSSARLRVHALWFDATSLWIGGYETTSCGPIDCKFQNQLVAAKWSGPTDSGPAWQHIPLLQGYSEPISDAISSSNGVQLLAVRGSGNQARVVRIADDASKLDAGAVDPETDEVGITDAGDHAWTRELAHTFGSPNAIWARSADDVWLVGQSGTVRHFDGTEWRLVPLALTRTTPLLQDLHDIHAGPVVAGEREIWVVGNDIALHRKVKE